MQVRVNSLQKFHGSVGGRVWKGDSVLLSCNARLTDASYWFRQDNDMSFS